MSFVLIVGIVCVVFRKPDNSKNYISENETVSAENSSVATSGVQWEIDENSSEGESGTTVDIEQSSKSNLSETPTSHNENTNQQENTEKPDNNDNSTIKPTRSSQSSVENQTSTIPSSSKSANTVASTAPVINATESETTVTYQYRTAKTGDDFSLAYAFPDNAIVITGVSDVSKDGVYVIPEKIDGKPVVAIMGLAFCDDKISGTVKKVVVPASVKTIWNYAFANCYNMSDIYFCGNAVYTEAQAFAGESKRTSTLTIHCSSTCSDRNFRYYKNKAVSYDAEYKEWNGGEYN